MKRSLGLAALLLATLVPVPALAQSTDRFGLDLGFFASGFNTELRLDSEDLGIGTEIDLENDLGLEADRGAFRLDGYYRFNPRHRIQFGYVAWSRKAERVISEDIQWGDEVYEVGARVASEFKDDLIKLAYKYSFVNTDAVEVGASFGVSAYSFEAALTAEASVEGGGSVEGQRESEDFIAPVPMVGVAVDWHVARTISLRFSGEFFDARVSGYDGTVTDSLFGVDWMLGRTAGLGLAYSYTSLKVQRDKDGEPDLELKYSYDGMYGYLILRF
jgi:hypothetical protein